MDGENDGKGSQAALAGEQEPQGDEAQAQPQQVDGGAGAGADGNADYAALLAERDAKIAALEADIAEAAKTAEAAEKLRAEMDELRRAGDEQRTAFELQMAGARNVKAAKALLADHGNDIEKLKSAEPWLFGAGAAAQAGATGLPNAGAAGDPDAQMRRWRGIAGLDCDGDKE